MYTYVYIYISIYICFMREAYTAYFTCVVATPFQAYNSVLLRSTLEHYSNTVFLCSDLCSLEGVITEQKQANGDKGLIEKEKKSVYYILHKLYVISRTYQLKLWRPKRLTQPR